MSASVGEDDVDVDFLRRDFASFSLDEEDDDEEETGNSLGESSVDVCSTLSDAVNCVDKRCLGAIVMCCWMIDFLLDVDEIDVTEYQTNLKWQ